MEIKDMHWHLFEAIQMDVDFLFSHGKIDKELVDECREISKKTVEGQVFDYMLRLRATELANKIYTDEYKAAFKEIHEKQDKERV